MNKCLNLAPGRMKRGIITGTTVGSGYDVLLNPHDQLYESWSLRDYGVAQISYYLHKSY